MSWLLVSCVSASYVAKDDINSFLYRKFKNKQIIEEGVNKWPGLKMAYGKPCHSQSQVKYILESNSLIYNDFTGFCREGK